MSAKDFDLGYDEGFGIGYDNGYACGYDEGVEVARQNLVYEVEVKLDPDLFKFIKNIFGVV